MDSEQIVGIIPDLKHKKGFLKYEPCSVIATGSRLIVAIMTKDMRKSLGDTPLDQKYRGMTADAILAETQGNFAIAADEIKRIRVQRGSGGDIDVSGGPDRLIVKTTSGKHLFTFGAESIPAKQARSILKETFGEIPK
jgi:hypothetical protein